MPPGSSDGPSHRPPGLIRARARVVAALLPTVAAAAGLAADLSAPARDAAASPVRPAACSANGTGNGQSNGVQVGIGNGYGNAGSGNGYGNGQGNSVVVTSGDGACSTQLSPAVHRPHLELTVGGAGRRLTIDIALASRARGALSITISSGADRVRPEGRHVRYTAIVPHSGAWTITASFTGHHGWRSQTVKRAVTLG